MGRNQPMAGLVRIQKTYAVTGSLQLQSFSDIASIKRPVQPKTPYRYIITKTFTSLVQRQGTNSVRQIEGKNLNFS